MTRLQGTYRTARWVTAASLILAACVSGDRPTLLEPSYAISDGVHSGGTPGFFFLPPVVSQPVVTGVFDADIAAVNPVVAICDVTDGPDPTCSALRAFTTISDPPITVDGDKYKVNWDTKEGAFAPGRTYRVYVLAGTPARELGFADILLTTEPGKVKKLADGEFVVLNDGRTLPIHFRVEQGVIVPGGPARSLELSGLPASLASGALASVTVTARDEDGNVASGYRGTVTFSAGDPAATLPADYTFTDADAGTHTFTSAVAFFTAGTVTLRVADAADATIAGEATITVLATGAVALDVTGLADPTVAGTAGAVTVTARDAHGNIASDYSGTIAFTSNDPQATLPADYTFVAGDAGTRVFPASATLRTAGSVTLNATDQAIAAITGAQTVTVTPAGAAEVVLTGVPDPATAGAAFSVTVSLRDPFANTATGYAGTLQLSSSDPSAVLPAAYQFQPADAGVRSFPGVTFKTAGIQSIHANDAAVPAIAGSVTVMVDPAAAAELRFTTQPAETPEGAAIAPPVVVTAFDQFGNTATGYAGQVTVAIGANPASGELLGTLQQAAVAGAATFDDLTITADGVGYTLTAAATALTGATSDPFTITAVQPPEVHWVNAGGGLWSAGANWSTGTPPAPDQAAFIDLAGTYAVTLDVNATVRSLSLGAASGAQTLSAGTGRVLGIATSGTILSTGRLTLSNATVNGPGALTNAAGGILTLSGTSTINTALVNAGTLVVFNSSVLNGTFGTGAGSLLRVQSVGFGGASLTVASGGFTNHGVIELTSTSANGVSLSVNGTLVNAPEGIITILPGAGGARGIGAQLDNQGTLTVDAALGLSRASADHVNSGTIVLNADLSIPNQGGTTPSFTNTGIVTVAPGKTWLISNSSFTHATGATLEGGGTLSLTQVNPAVFNTAFTIAALSLSGTTANFATDITTATLALSVGNSTVNGPITLTNAATKTLALAGTCVINTPLVNAGSLVVVNSSTLNSTFTTIPGSLVRVQSIGFGGAALTVASGSFTNHGAIELTGLTTNGVSFTVNGTLLNAADGTITTLVGAGGARALGAQLDNQGTVTVMQALTLSRGSADHVNGGTIVLNADLVIPNQGGTTPSFTNSGTVTVNPGRTWSISNASFTQATGATLNGGGAVTLTSVNPAVFQTAFTVGALTLSGTVAGFATDISTETLALNLINATVNGPGTLTNAATKTLNLSGTTTINTALVNAGTMVTFNASTLNGGFTTAAGSLLRVQSVGFGGATLTVASGFTNLGAIELTSTTTNGCALNVNGTLVNAAGATISILAGGGGARTLTAQLDNQGTLTLAHPLTINRGSADHLNSGTIRLNAGNLAVTQSGTTPSFTNTGLIDLVGTGAFTVGVGPVTNGAGATIQGAGTFEAGASAPLSNAGTIDASLVRIGNSLTGTGTFAPVTAEFFSGATSIPVGAGYTYTHVRVLNATSFAGPATLAGDLTVAGSGNLTIGAHAIAVGGSFATQGGTAVLTMQNAAGSLIVSGGATFGGGGTNGRLTAGALRVAGAFAQAGGSPAAFAAAGTHLTVLNGAAAQSLSFANPGTTTVLSHFQRLEIDNAGADGVALGSNVFANGQLRTPAGPSVPRVIAGAGRTLQAGGLDAVGLVLDAALLRVVTGDALTAFDDAVFRNMDPAVTQFRLDRLNDVVTFNNLQFLTEPTTGVYLHLVDTDLAAPLFTVTMVGTQPANHGGRVIESVAGQLVGWPL